MDIKHLVTFLKVIETGSFTRAAELLGYTQSSVTAHIQTIEEHLNAPLFDRLGRKIHLTDAGKEALPHIKNVIEHYKRLESIGSDKATVKGELKITATESITLYRLEPILRTFKEQHPEVKLTLSNATCSTNKSAVLNGDTDLAFVLLPLVEEVDLVTHALTEEDIIVVGNQRIQDHVLQPDQPLQESILLNEYACSYRSIFEQALKEQNISAVQSMELWSVEALKRCAVSGLGITCLPRMTVETELETGTLKRIPFHMEPTLYSQLIYRKDKWLSPAITAFIDIVLEQPFVQKTKISFD
ncbi:LysR family transcriptional regulator [Geomicrobium sediminis]|uniref:DNA-binding transcriptional LysR family regulator n=1 Tax=Geomicrobium sediminis TaxID=1347788 RepID=A0ABS2PE62_9BACL|nr:LysR family transcriptional regulator [Geomicrobium sediminis]MBM7633103.1 DNA-binding transcriptional LysR family regulator [Geomicrobium sediminis]